ncbi:hypothetical protein HPP92_026219 [Vanilla planifolia]|uniref:Uncharacterized protein n=1 Tax=Vanilla planifolia TaxID=51239 RepID=A0A835U9W0_VANPL|nr:hypothetical protein HPP92_026219 [Vanilla planifolia]
MGYEMSAIVIKSKETMKTRPDLSARDSAGAGFAACGRLDGGDARLPATLTLMLRVGHRGYSDLV